MGAFSNKPRRPSWFPRTGVRPWPRAGATFAVLAAGLAATTKAQASPLGPYGFGSRESAMVGAMSGDATGPSATFYNPAGLSFGKGLALSAGYFRVDQRLKLNGQDSKVDPVKGLVAGIAAPGKIGGIPFGFGVATHLPDERLSRIRTLKPSIPRWERFDNRAQLLFLGAAVSIRPLPWLGIGFGMHFLSSTRGDLAIRGQAKLRDLYDSQLEHEVDADLTTERIIVAGIRATPNEQWSFGLTYRGESKLDLALDAGIKGEVDSQIGVIVPVQYDLTSQSLDAFQPAQLVLGSSFQPNDDWRVNLDLTWTQWSRYESATSYSTSSLDIDLAGLPIAVPPDPEPTPYVDPGFSNTLMPSLGVEYTGLKTGALGFPLRAGYRFDPSPVPEQTGASNLVDRSRHVFALGFGLRWDKPAAFLPGALTWDVHGAYAHFPESLTRKANPADFVGNYTAGGNQTQWGSMLGVEFK